MKPLAPLVLAIALATSMTSAQAAEIKVKLGAIHIAVANFDKSAAFYQVLGMHRGADYVPEAHRLVWGDPSQGPELILMQAKDGGEGWRHRGSAALSYQVSDIRELADRLRAAGYAVGEPRDVGPYLILLLKDPDGNSIELGQPTGRDSVPVNR